MPLDPSDILLSKAREDAHLALLVVDDSTVSDEHLGFFCQQAVEKGFKSLLSRLGVTYRRNHDLAGLLDLLKDNAVAFPPELEQTVILTPFAAAMRYDYLPVDAEEPFDRRHAVKLMGLALDWVQTQSPRPANPD